MRQFDTPRQPMSFPPGLVPAERPTGEYKVRRKGLTLAGNRRARRALIEAEAGLAYRYPRESQRGRLESLGWKRCQSPCRDIAWKAQIRSVRPLPSAQRHR